MTGRSILSFLAIWFCAVASNVFADGPNGVVAWQEMPQEKRFGDGDSIKNEFDKIRNQPEFRRLRKSAPQQVETKPGRETPEWISNLFNKIGDMFKSIGNWFSALGLLIRILLYGVMGAIFAAIVWLIVKTVQRYQARQKVMGPKFKAEEGEADAPPGDLPSDEYLRRAAEFGQKGLYREAIAQLILGAMSQIERGNFIRFRRGLTYRDYLRAIRSLKTAHTAFQKIVSVYEPICFGRREALVGHYQISLDGYQIGFSSPLIGEEKFAINSFNGFIQT